MTPTGCLVTIQNDLAKLGKARRIDRLQAYLKTERFRAMFMCVPPDRLEALVRHIARTRKACKLPAKPKPIGSGRIKWTPALKARLASLYATFGPTAHVPVAAEMGLSPGQVRLAKRTFLDNQAPFQIAA